MVPMLLLSWDAMRAALLTATWRNCTIDEAWEFCPSKFSTGAEVYSGNWSVTSVPWITVMTGTNLYSGEENCHWVTFESKGQRSSLNCSGRWAESPWSQPHADGREGVWCRAVLCFSAAEASWASLGGRPQGGQVRRLGNDVERGPGVSFGENKHTKRERLVPTPDRTAIWKHICSQRVQGKTGFKDHLLPVSWQSQTTTVITRSPFTLGLCVCSWPFLASNKCIRSPFLPFLKLPFPSSCPSALSSRTFPFAVLPFQHQHMSRPHPVSPSQPALLPAARLPS